MMQHSDTSAIGHLVLTRLLPSRDKGATTSQIKKDLEPLLQHRWAGAVLADMLDRTLGQLDAEGLISRSRGKGRSKVERSVLTPQGCQRGLDFLDLDKLPPKATWASLKKTYLLARMLGLPGPAGSAAKAFSSDGGYKAALLRRQFDLPIDEYPTLAKATEALAWKLLGLESHCHQKFSIRAVQVAIFNRELGDQRPSDRQADPRKAVDRLLSKGVNARRDDAKELREAAMRQWVDRSTADPALSPDSPAEPLDLRAFAEHVLAAARSSPTGRFGDNKVFIAHLWSAAQDDSALRGMDLDTFKQRLGEANNARLLDLSRADLVEAMDPEDVRTSETRYYNATFHFVRLPERTF